jgi:hypothetical protein
MSLTAQKTDLKEKIAKLQGQMDSSTTPDNIKALLKGPLENLRAQLADIEKLEKQTAIAKKEDTPPPAPAVIKKEETQTRKIIAKAKDIEKKVVAAKKHKPHTPSGKRSLKALIKGSRALLALYAGKSESDLKRDAQRKAKVPGSRTSASGNVYREYRANRTDINRKAPHLAKGGTIKKKAENENEMVVAGVVHRKVPADTKVPYTDMAVKENSHPLGNVYIKGDYGYVHLGYDWWKFDKKDIEKLRKARLSGKYAKGGTVKARKEDRRTFDIAGVVLRQYQREYFKQTQAGWENIDRIIATFKTDPYDFGNINMAILTMENYLKEAKGKADSEQVDLVKRVIKQFKDMPEVQAAKNADGYAKGGKTKTAPTNKEAELVDFKSKYDGKVKAYRSTSQNDLYFYLSDNGGNFSILSEAKGYPPTEAFDDWIVDREAAMKFAKDLAEGKDPLEKDEYAKGGSPKGKKDKVNPYAITFGDINRICEKENDFNEAIVLVQDIINQPYGDVAGVHFSGRDGDAEWSDKDKRKKVLIDYMEIEELYVDEEDRIWLSVDGEPTSYWEFVVENTAEDVDPLTDEEFEEIKNLKLGKSVYNGGQAGVEIKRVKNPYMNETDGGEYAEGGSVTIKDPAKWLTAAEAYLDKRYSIGLNDTGITIETAKTAIETGETPEEYVDDYGLKHDLDRTDLNAYGFAKGGPTPATRSAEKGAIEKWLESSEHSDYISFDWNGEVLEIFKSRDSAPVEMTREELMQEGVELPYAQGGSPKGKKDNVNPYAITFSDIDRICKEDDVNKAIKKVQGIIGQTAGDIAGIHFADMLENDELPAWKNKENRKGIIIKYLAEEESQINKKKVVWLSVDHDEPVGFWDYMSFVFSEDGNNKEITNRQVEKVKNFRIGQYIERSFLGFVVERVEAPAEHADDADWHQVGLNRPPAAFPPEAVAAFKEAFQRFNPASGDPAALTALVNIVASLLYKNQHHEATEVHSLLQEVGIYNYKTGMVLNTEWLDKLLASRGLADGGSLDNDDDDYEEEHDVMIDEQETDEPQWGEDCFIKDVVRGGYDVSCSGKHIGHYTEVDDAVEAVVEWQQNNAYWPTIWMVGERGDHWAIDHQGNAIRYAVGGTVKKKPSIFLEHVSKDVTEDDWDKGQDPDSRRHVLSERENRQFSSTKELFDYLKTQYGIENDPKKYTAFEDGRLIYSRMENDEGDEPSSRETEYFKAGKGKLWAADYDIYVSYGVISDVPVKKMHKDWGVPTYAVGGTVEAGRQVMFTSTGTVLRVLDNGDVLVRDASNNRQTIPASRITELLKKGGRLKSALMRDRKYQSGEPWEQNYQRSTRPRHPHYAYAKGGAISNQYEGKTPEEIWNAWSPDQRVHFLHDHGIPDKDVLDRYKNEQWKDIGESMQKYVRIHVSMGQYAKGGLPKGKGVNHEYFASIDWVSTAGNPRTDTAVIVATDAAIALQQLEDRVRAKKTCMKINGGSVSMTEYAKGGRTDTGDASGITEEEQEANARLIAAAPAMYDALRKLLDALIHVEGDTKGNKARTEIIKQCENFREAIVNARNILTYKIKSNYAAGGNIDHYPQSGRFSIDGKHKYPGLYDPKVKWNGWACPIFNEATTIQILKDMGIPYRWEGENRDLLINEDDNGFEEVSAVTAPGKRRWFALGSHSWVWEEVSGDNKMAAGGRTTRGISRDRKFKSQEPHEQAYNRKKSPKNPRYQTAIERAKKYLKNAAKKKK